MYYSLTLSRKTWIAVAVMWLAVFWFMHGAETAIIEVLAAANFISLWQSWREPLYRAIMIFAAVVLFAISITMVSYTMSIILVSLALLVLFAE